MTSMRPAQRQRVRHAISFFYDMQKLRIQAGNRASGQAEDSEIQLDEDDITFFQKQSSGLNELEKGALGYVERQLRGIPIYEQWLKKQAGCGPTMSGFLISEIDIRRCETVSQLWAYFGLAVGDDGRAQRRVKGEKSGFDPWRKSKVVLVLGECLIKASGARTKKLRVAAIEAALGTEYLSSVAYRDLIDTKFPELTPSERTTKGVTKTTNEFLGAVVEEHGIHVESAGGWTKFYDDYKHRKASEMVPVCMNCDGSGEYTAKAKGVKGGKKGTEGKTPGPPVKCGNCNGTGGPAPWGRGPAHRHAAARRRMVKAFLEELWWTWRKLEGLSTPGSYAERYLGMAHGSHGPDPALARAEDERRRERYYHKTKASKSKEQNAAPE